MLYLKEISIFSRANFKLDRIFSRNYKRNWNIDSSQNYTDFGSLFIKIKSHFFYLAAPQKMWGQMNQNFHLIFTI
jgi:hypothetical protein